MPNLPGLSGYQTPKVVARDKVVSRGVSVPGGLRLTCIVGEGLREETIVSSATGGGADGSSAASPTGSADGRLFALSSAPVVSGRTELYLNGTLLYGIEDEIDEDAFDKAFDFRVDPETGHIELQGSSIGDQGGKSYSASSLNSGTGVIVDGTCGTFDLVSVIDDSAPAERWTVKCISVIRDTNGDPVPGKAKFTLTGSVSGQLRNASGNPIIFDSNYKTGTTGAVSGTSDVCSDSYVVAISSDFQVGSAVLNSGDASTGSTDTFEFIGDLVTQGQVLVGDTLCIDGYVGIDIEDIEYDSSTGKTTLTLETDSLSTSALGIDWEIRANNLFIDNSAVLHNGVTGAPASSGQFVASDVGKVLMICSGDSAGTYEITNVTSSRRVRLRNFSDSSLGLPTMVDDNSDGLAETGLTWNLLQSNGVLLFGIQERTVPFSVGDKFFIDVESRVLAKGDSLTAKYISESDLNDPEFFESANDLVTKHGTPSVTNSLSLAAQMAFENGAPGVWAVQAKPSLPRRTSQTLLAERDRNGNGGFNACGGNSADCEIDDLKFIIPRPLSGLRSAKPNGDSQVNIFVVRDGTESQIFPNKVPFYNSQFENAVGQNTFISDNDYTFSYTIINTDTKVLGQGYDGNLTSSDGTFSTDEFDFDADHVGSIIVVQSIEDSSGNVYTTEEEISTYLFGSSSVGVELVIVSVSDDNTVDVLGNDNDDTALIADAVDVQFFIKDISDTTNTSAALLLHKDLVDSGTFRDGDGLRISYIDRFDSDFYDVNWFEALEAIEAIDCQIIVPVPLQNKSGIFRAVANHVETMSSIAIQQERVALIGAMQGITTDALIGREEVAVEDIGVLEGIQGDDAEEILAGNNEDLVDYKLDRNYTSNRVMYFWPDRIVRNVEGTNTFIDGFYIAAAAAGWFSSQQNVALPLTNKSLSGFSILRDKKLRPQTMNLLGGVGATIVQPITGGGLVINGRTTSQSGFVEDEEISVIFIRDRVKLIVRQGLRSYIGGVDDVNTAGLMASKVIAILSSALTTGLITSFENVRVQRDKVDPRQWNVFFRFRPVFPINYIFIDIEVGIS